MAHLSGVLDQVAGVFFASVSNSKANSGQGICANVPLVSHISLSLNFRKTHGVVGSRRWCRLCRVGLRRHWRARS